MKKTHKFMSLIIMITVQLIVFCGHAISAQPTPLISTPTAVTPWQLYDEMNKAYERMDFAAAIMHGEKLTGQSKINASVYYNLGNAYYRNNEFGKAILNYRRGLRLSPRDEDIRHNLNFTCRIRNEKVWTNFFERTLSYFKTTELLAALIVCSLIFSILWMLYILTTSRSYYWLTLASAAVLIISGTLFFTRWQIFENNTWATVIVDQTPVYSGPGQEYVTSFNIPEGKHVIILGADNHWYAINLPSEHLKGWLEKSNTGIEN
ncbi:MAG: tetratricopeptide repeat protein [Elusimicrobiota bacterium]